MTPQERLRNEAFLVSPTAKITTATVWSNGKMVRRYCGQDHEDSGNYVKNGAARGFRKMTMILIDNDINESGDS